MTLDEIFRKFATGIAEIELYRSSASGTIEREAEHLQEQKEIIRSGNHSEIFSIQQMFFQDVTSGQPVFYGLRKMSIDRAIDSLQGFENRQHQWFLAEAYELFEDFMSNAYAYMGLHHPKLWPLRDFGSIQWDDARSMNFDWYLSQARQKKDAPLGAMRQFRKVLPRMASVEPDNRLGGDLQVLVMLVAQMRHQIVHARGIIKDKARFLTDLLKKLGYTGAGADPHLAYLDEWLLINQEDGAIWLLDVIDSQPSPLVSIYTDNFTKIIRSLLVYAHQIYISLGGPATMRFDE